MPVPDVTIFALVASKKKMPATSEEAIVMLLVVLSVYASVT
jgi:hypothetical protein